MLWFVSFFNYADRTALFTVMPSIRSEYALTATQLGLLSSVFMWIYALAALPAGWIADRFSRKTVILAGLIAWSIITFLTPFASSFAALLLLRAFTGLGEAFYYPAGTALISDHHGPSTRGRALSLHQTAVFAGGGLGAVVAASMAESFGWRSPFLLFGAAGVVLAIILVPLLSDAPRQPAVTDAAPEARLSDVLGNQRVLLMCGAFFFATAATAGVTVWAPTFFHDVHGLSLTQSSVYGSATINLAGLLAVPIGGIFADMAAVRWRNGRILLLLIALTAAGVCLLPMAVVAGPAISGVLLIASSGCKGLFDGAIYATMHDLVAPRARGMAVGLMTTIGFAGAGLAPLLVAFLSERLGLAEAFAALALLFGLGAAVLALLIRWCPAGTPAAPPKWEIR